MAYECRRTTGRREKQTGEADMQKWGSLKQQGKTGRMEKKFGFNPQ